MESRTKRILYIFPISEQLALTRSFRRKPSKTSSRQGPSIASIILRYFCGYPSRNRTGAQRNAGISARRGGLRTLLLAPYADYVDENLWVEFLLPTALHQDSRYYTLGRGGFAKRLGYLCHVAVITRKDSGHETFKYFRILRRGRGVGHLQSLYPSQERTFTKTYQLLVDEYSDRRWIEPL